jgi:sec-independent protein translocase protein TatC
MFKFLLSKLADKKEDASFWEHAEVLRKFIIKSIIAVVILSIAAFFFKDLIFNNIILSPKDHYFITYRVLCRLGSLLNMDSLCIGDFNFRLINLTIAGQLRWHIIISCVAGLILAFPYILYCLWDFVRPALSAKEAKSSRHMMFYAFLLFIIGLFFGYYIILPLSIYFLANYELSSQITNQITISSYISTVTILPLSIGFIFELPALVYFLSKTGIVSLSFLKKNRKYSVIIVLIVAAIITPSTDAFTMIVVALPFYLLYELSIFITAGIEKKKKLV